MNERRECALAHKAILDSMAPLYFLAAFSYSSRKGAGKRPSQGPIPYEMEGRLTHEIMAYIPILSPTSKHKKTASQAT